MQADAAEDDGDKRGDARQHERELGKAYQRNPRTQPCCPIEKVAMFVKGAHPRLLDERMSISLICGFNFG